MQISLPRTRSALKAAKMPACCAALFLAAATLSGCARQGGFLTALGSQILPANNQQFDPAQVPSGRYVVDPEHVSVLFEVNHFGFSNYVGRFNEVRGSILYDARKPTAASLDVEIPTASVDVNNEKLEGLLRGPAGFDAQTFPLARFTSRALTLVDQRRGKLAGDLTLRGVTHPVNLDVVFNGGAPNGLTGRYTLGFHAVGAIERSQWGLTAWLPAVGDAVTISIRVEFVAAPAA
jgi:polyisoprenoid-binding protein YceI